MTINFVKSLLILLIGVLINTSMLADDALHLRPRYLLRSGDTLELQYRLTPELNQTVMVQPDGYVSLNVAGNVQVAGLSIDQAHELILAKASKSLKDPELNLVLETFTHPYVMVAGQVEKPGQIDVKENTTALSAILLSGGFTQNAKSGQVIVFRKVNDTIAEVKTLKMTNIHKTVQLEQDMVLQPGDMIFVPRDKINRIEHYMQIANVGLYTNPVDFIR